MAALHQVTDAHAISPDWKRFLKVGGYASLLSLLLALFEILITFLPGGNTEGLDTVVDWFNFFEEYPLMGLRTLGLVNFGLISLGVVVMVALYGALQNTDRGWITLAAVLSFIKKFRRGYP